MEYIINNQPIFLYNCFYKYLSTYKQVVKFYTCNKLLLNYFKDINFNNIFYTPQNWSELKIRVNNWYYNPKKSEEIYRHISTWNTSNITEMSELFMYKYHFNDNISEWNTSNVIDMSHMFYHAESFQQSIKNWDLSNLKNLNLMFHNAIDFHNSEHNNDFIQTAIKYDINILELIKVGHE